MKKQEPETIRRSSGRVITFYDAGFARFGDLAWAGICAYAERQGLDSARFSQRKTDRPAPWEKIICIQESLDAGYDFVLWIDADAMIVDLEADIRREIDGSPDKDFFLVRHEIGGGLSPNTGVIAVRNSERAKAALKRIWEMERFANHRWWEQAAFISWFGLVDLLPEADRKTFVGYPDPEGRDERGDSQRIQWIDARWNCIPGVQECDGPAIMHYAGLRWFRRLDGMIADAFACGYVRIETGLLFWRCVSWRVIARARIAASAAYGLVARIFG